MINLAKNGCSIVFKDSGFFKVMQDQDIILSGNLVNGVMELDLVLGKSNIPKDSAMTTQPNGILLHRRLGHTGRRPFEKVFPNTSYPLTVILVSCPNITANLTQVIFKYHLKDLKLYTVTSAASSHLHHLGEGAISLK